jgi:hypothetical protein
MRLAAHLVLVVATGAFAYAAGWQNGHLGRFAESDSATFDRENLHLLRDAADQARADGDDELAKWYDEAARGGATRWRQGGRGQGVSLAAGGH